MATEKEIDAFSSIPLFSGLTPSELHEVVSQAHIYRVNPDEFYFLQGDSANTVYVLREGRVKLTQISSDGQQVLLRVIGPWSLFAIVALSQGKNYPVSAQATEKGSAYAWQREELVKMTKIFPRMAMNAMQLMADYLQEFQDRLREIATQRVERRLARTLIRLAGQAGVRKKDGVLIDLQLTRQDLAEMIGTTLFTVSRILSQWESSGLVQSGRERVVILNTHGLVQIAEDL